MRDVSWRRFEDLLKTSWQDVLKMSWRRLEDVMARRLEDVLKTYGQDEYIGLGQDVLETSSEDIWLIRIYSSSSRCHEDVFIKTNVCWVVIMIIRLILISFFNFFIEMKNEKRTVFRCPCFLWKWKTNEGIKKSKKKSIKYENSSQLFKFRLFYWSKSKI